MNQVIRYGSVQAIPIYNCSAHTPEEWTKRDGVSRPILGITEASLGILINICYIPILFVMLEKEHFKISCYKIMSFLAIIDMLSIVVDCIITGWLAYQGAVFCSYPTLIYFSGMSGTGLWCCTCVTALILIVNRIFDLLVPRARIFFFEGNRTFLVILGAVLYTLYYVFCNTPSLFTSKFHSWFFTPMIFEGRDMDYENVPMFFNNIGVVFVTCLLYILFCFVLGAKLKNVSTGSESRSASIQIFFQSAMICAFNLMASLIYISMNYIEVPFWLIILGQFSWQLGNSAPVFIYMKFNKTLRNGVLKNLGIKVHFCSCQFSDSSSHF
ncbi:hypothetical protein CRE_22138 [Caenorhabditis remanei]|uniref:Uncharacterized protein n=1 Tax=Caenorhabditis remanei TaxID=31234 RepID=E3NIZ0_CAERE|nr:hypothetical protein CRE_22138 [Caenorhabditis remanei]